MKCILRVRKGLVSALITEKSMNLPVNDLDLLRTIVNTPAFSGDALKSLRYRWAIFDGDIIKSEACDMSLSAKAYTSQASVRQQRQQNELLRHADGNLRERDRSAACPQTICWKIEFKLDALDLLHSHVRLSRG
jgi:hypothetical protein